MVTVKPKLGEVQETLLIPLYGRAVETHKPNGMLKDPRAVEMVDAIDYDFSRFEVMKNIAGANLRTLVFDEWVRRFLVEAPAGTVIEVGTGLNTRFERVDNGQVHWFDTDLPDAIALRRAFFRDDDRRRMIAASVVDESWTREVLSSPGPYFFVAEAVLQFLPRSDVKQAFSLLADKFPGGTFAVDSAGTAMLNDQNSIDILGTVNARMQWCCDDPHEPEEWHPSVSLIESVDFTNLPSAVFDKLPAVYQEQMRAYAEANQGRSQAYRINLYRF